ncbi:MAG: integrase core domain-containing protein [Nanoarchaeota archaeon]
MKYSNDVVENIVARLASGEVRVCELSRVVGIPRGTVSRWLKRKLAGQPARLKRAAKRVWNKTVQLVLDEIKALLQQGLSTTLTWLKMRKRCLRTIQRYNKQWFPPKIALKVKPKRYERRKAFSLTHTDWGVKRIKKGVRCCFSFYVDDATRKLFALRAYPRATLENSIHNLNLARKQTGGFKAVLSDNGRQYLKGYDAELHGIKHIHTRVNNPKCNGKAEAVVKKVKNFLKKFEVRDLEHANELFSRYKREYNNTPHSGLKYRTPNQVFRDKRKNGAISAVT